MDNEEKNQIDISKDFDSYKNKLQEKESQSEIKEEIERREKIDETKEEIGEIEDTTKYGEFVSSYFAWLTLDRQKKTAKKLENITKKGKEF